MQKVSAGDGTTIQRVNKYGIQPGIKPGSEAVPKSVKKVDPTKGKKQVKRTDFKDKSFKPRFEHYSWRDSFDFELTENQANRMKMVKQRTAQNQGRAAQQFSALKAKPIVRKPEEALNCILRNDLEYLVISNFIVKKNN